MVQLTNLSRAYDVMAQLAETAEAAGFKNYTTMISPENGGALYFKVPDIGAELGRAFLRGIETESPDTFIRKAEEFRTYWLDLMEKAKETNAARIAELKAELAKLEGRA